MRLVYLSLAWILGIYLGYRWDFRLGLFAVAAGTFFILTLLSYFRSRRSVLLLLCLCFLCAGVWRFEALSEGDGLQAYRGDYLLQGVVTDDPDVRDLYTTLRLEVFQVETEGAWRDVSGTALAYVSSFADPGGGRDFPYYRYGDLLQLRGRLQDPSQNDEFDFKAYLARQGVYSVLSNPRDILLVDEHQKSGYKKALYTLRNEMADSLETSLHDPQSALAKAMLLGQRGSISPQLRQDFSRSGTSHLLAISGVHVSIIAGMVLALGVWLLGRHRPYYFWLTLLVVWGYVALAGMPPSAVRAGIMLSLWLYAGHIGRSRSSFVALIFAAALMLVFDPRLLSDVGFQLSFAAVAGLIFMTPRFQARATALLADSEGKVSAPVAFATGSFAVTLGAVLATLPLIAYYFGTISLVSLPATFLTLPAVPGVILSSAATAFAGLVSPGLADISGWIAWLFISWVVQVAEFFAALPFSSCDLKMTAPLAGGYYFLLAGVLWLPSNRNVPARMLNRMRYLVKASTLKWNRFPAALTIVPLLIIAGLIWTAFLTVSDGNLHIKILDIGQGDAIFISRGETQILIDGGPSPDALADRLGKELPFWDRKIELVILTHPDADHLTGLLDLVRRYDVSKVLSSGQEVDSDLYRQWRSQLTQKGIEPMVAQKGQQIFLGPEVEITVLHPDGNLSGEVNDNSVVMRLSYGRFSMLFTGDAGYAVEEALIEDNPTIKSSVLKVSHHGSDSATGQDFLDRVDPLLAVVSVGDQNKFGHPAEAVMSRLQEAVGPERIYLTSQHGAIDLVTDGETLWLK